MRWAADVAHTASAFVPRTCHDRDRYCDDINPKYEDLHMSHRSALVLAAVAALTWACPAAAVDQTVPGPGNAEANVLAAATPRVREAHEFLVSQAKKIKNPSLRSATLNLLDSSKFCLTSRVGVDDAKKSVLLAQLVAAGFVDPSNDVTGTNPFPGGLKAGVFPAILDEGTACPHMPMRFDAAPGSSFTSHHGYPGGLPIHEANNLRAALGLADGYRSSYSTVEGGGRHEEDDDEGDGMRPFFIDQDIMIAAPIWHDWGKTMVFQWTADGQEYKELNIGGTPTNGSATGGHHIISIAESMKRGLPPAFVIAQASAHSNPTLGNEFKVVAWLRAAGILAQVDPVATGYLMVDGTGWRLPALRKLADSSDFVATKQANLLVEYTLHNLSDGDFTFSIPAAGEAKNLIDTLAPSYGYSPVQVDYNTKYRNKVFANLSQERLLIVYANGGLTAVKAELDALRARGVI
jgi:hypothetical protein